MNPLRRVLAWSASSLRRRLALLLATVLALVSLVFLAVFVGLYQKRLHDAQVEASASLNRLFRVALENAMLKRDLDGLRTIVRRLGDQEDVQRVLILDPRGEVRFASDPDLLGRRFVADRDPGCVGCHRDDPDRAGLATVVPDAVGGGELLRSVLPVRNREICGPCHGPPENHPINGVLVVDREIGAVRREAMLSAMMLAGSGVFVLFLTLGGLTLALDRVVLRRIRRLTHASRRLAEGELATRADIPGEDEVARLAAAFDRMADRIERDYRTLEARERFERALMEAIPDGVRVIADDFRVVAANRAFAEMHGRDPAEVVGALCYRSSHGRDEPCVPTLVTCPLEALAADGDRLRCLHRHLRRDGREFPVEIVALRIDLPDGEASRSYVVESVRDLEEKAQATQEQRLSELGQLATGVAHEIRNPLSSIRIALHALKTPGIAAAERETYMALVETEIDKCIDITDRLLRLALPSHGERELVSLARIVEEVLSLLAFEAERSNVRIEIDVAEDATVLGSDGDLRMVVLNLAQNAFHAMPEGGRLRVEGRVRGEIVRLTVADTGAGIPPEHLSKIFMPFWSRRADRQPGTGLGLWIVRSIIQRHRGRITVESAPGKGARFVVELPSARHELETWERKQRESPSS